MAAVFANNGFSSFKKKDKIEIVKEYGKDFDSMVLLTGLALVEKERRRSLAWRWIMFKELLSPYLYHVLSEWI